MISRIKHRGETHTKYILTVTLHSLFSEAQNVSFPDSLFLKWATSKQKGQSKGALVMGKKAVFDETITLKVTFYQNNEQHIQKKHLILKVLKREGSSRRTKSLATVDIDLSKFAVLDGNSPQIIPVPLEGISFPTKLHFTVKSLWVNDGSNRSNRPRSLSNVNQLTLSSLASTYTDDGSKEERTSSSAPDFSEDEEAYAEEMMEEGENDANYKALGKITSFASPHHPDPKREQALLTTLGDISLSVADVVFLVKRMDPKDQERVLGVMLRQKQYNKKMSKELDKEFPNDFLYAIMNRTDIGHFLTDMKPFIIEFYLNQLCALLLFCPNDFPKLEAFILAKCGVDVYFAIQVYWFFVAALDTKALLDNSLQEHATRLKQEISKSVAEKQAQQLTLFHEEVGFVDALVMMGKEILGLPKERRLEALRARLTRMNDNFSGANPHRAYIPLRGLDKPQQRIIRLVPDLTVVFGTAHRAPFLFYAEILEEVVETPTSPPGTPGTPGMYTDEDGERKKHHRERMKEVVENFPFRKDKEKEREKESEKEKEREKQREKEYEKGKQREEDAHLDLDSPASPRRGNRRPSLTHSSSPPNSATVPPRSPRSTSPSPSPSLPPSPPSPSPVPAASNASIIRAKLEDRILWSKKEKEVRTQSPHGNDPRWSLVSAIVKAGDDLRQERLAVQLIKQIELIFREFKLPLYLFPYRVVAVSSESGLIETVTNAITLDSLKGIMGPTSSLMDYFRLMFGSEHKGAFKRARENFVASMAAYSLVCYILQIKDRHGGNIMIDAEGHVVHIDFGFMLAKKQIKLLNTNFEKAPFKLTPEFVAVMGGVKSSSFKQYKELMKKGYRKLRKRHYKLSMLVDIVGSTMRPACITETTTAELESRFNLYMTKKEANKFVSGLIKEALNSTSTTAYDYFNKKRFGILS